MEQEQQEEEEHEHEAGCRYKAGCMEFGIWGELSQRRSLC